MKVNIQEVKHLAPPQKKPAVLTENDLEITWKQSENKVNIRIFPMYKICDFALFFCLGLHSFQFG